MTFWLLVHVFTSLFMCGLCWFVQVVHYPLFLKIDPQDFPGYEFKNIILTGIIAVPIMTIELGSGVYLAYHDWNNLHLFNLILMALTGASTFIFQAPIHLKLSTSHDFPLIKKLIRTNWIRTISWTLRVFILALLIKEISF